MAFTERQGITGKLTILLKDASGKVIDQRQVSNVITSAGKNLIAGYFTGAIEGTPTLSVVVGSGEVEASVGDTGLGDSIEEAEADSQVVGNKATVTATLPAREAGEVQELKEAGIRVAVPGLEPVLYNRVTFPVVNKSPNMEMTLTWEVEF